jgi:hypothetical protein
LLMYFKIAEFLKKNNKYDSLITHHRHQKKGTLK